MLGIFTFPCDNVFNFNANTLALAKHLGISATEEKPTPGDIERYIEQGCECFLSAGYPFKIPPVDEKRAYAINAHPSLLPQGRGLMPIPHIIINHPKASGLTIHKLSPKFDEGDILHQTYLPVGVNETVETLSARIAMRAPDVISMLLTDMQTYWAQASPQISKKASYFPPPAQEMRMLDWAMPVSHIDKVARAFGRYGSLARFDGALWVVYDHDVWAERHAFKPGEVATRLPRETIIAAKDGFVCLKEYHKAEEA